MFVEPFFMQSAVGALVAPAISNLTSWLRSDTTQWGTSPIAQAYTSGSGNVGFLGCVRGTTVNNRLLGSDWNGDVSTSLVTAKQDQSLNLSCCATLKTGGFVGAGTMHATSNLVNTDNFRFLNAWIFDLDQVRGGVGGAAASVIAVAQDFIEVTLPVAQAGSLLIAGGWNQQENLRPFVWPAGWTKIGADQLTGTGDQPAGSLASKISTASGSEVIRMSGGTAGTVPQWAIAAIELLPG